MGSKGATGAAGTPEPLWRRLYRDFWLLAITVAVAVALVRVFDVVNEVQEGRRTGTTITCVITSAVLEGSHSFIISSSAQPLPPKLEKSLREQGYPSQIEREVKASESADAYTAGIEKRVEEVASQAKGLIGSAGKVNCALLDRVSKVH